MNYVDDDFIHNELKKIHKKGKDITIDWLTGEFEPVSEKNDRLTKSIGHWRDGLEKHLAQQNVELNVFRTLNYCWPTDTGHFMEAQDDKGKAYKIEIAKTK